jgi:hypothetical protein
MPTPPPVEWAVRRRRRDKWVPLCNRRRTALALVLALAVVLAPALMLALALTIHPARSQSPC